MRSASEGAPGIEVKRKGTIECFGELCVNGRSSKVEGDIRIIAVMLVEGELQNL